MILLVSNEAHELEFGTALISRANRPHLAFLNMTDHPLSRKLEILRVRGHNVFRTITLPPRIGPRPQYSITEINIGLASGDIIKIEWERLNFFSFNIERIKLLQGDAKRYPAADEAPKQSWDFQNLRLHGRLAPAFRNEVLKNGFKDIAQPGLIFRVSDAMPPLM